MIRNLTNPIWPQTRFNLTTPLNLIFTLICVVLGIGLCSRGFTYEGSMIAYMVGGVIFAYPYYRIQYTGFMTFVVMACFIPISIWAQNKAVEAGSWGYRPMEEYLLWITKRGEGVGGWTRHLWLGNDMPAMEYAFYIVFCFFHMTMFSLFSYCAPDNFFKPRFPKLQRLFLLVFLPYFVSFIAIYFLYPSEKYTDYLYWLAIIGYLITIGGYLLSPSFRGYIQSPAFWIWYVGVGLCFMPAWEYYHACVNRDWIYNLGHTFPPTYTCGDNYIPISELLGYVTSATTFQALMFSLGERLGQVAVREKCILKMYATK